MERTHFRAVSLITLACLSFGACSQSPASEEKAEAAKIAAQIDAAEPIRQYELRGQVQRLDIAGKIATIKHEPIGDWMGAMTMEFPVRDAADFVKLREGVPVKAIVFVQGINYWLGGVKDDLAVPLDRPAAAAK